MNDTIKKLKIIKSVEDSSWCHVRTIVAMIADGDVEVICKRWSDNFKHMNYEAFPLDLLEFETWSTYTDCTMLEFTYISDSIITCNVEVWDGDILEGQPMNKRFTCSLNIPATFVSNIKDEIDYMFESHLEYLHRIYLETEKKKWIEQCGKDLLTNLN